MHFFTLTKFDGSISIFMFHEEVPMFNGAYNSSKVFNNVRNNMRNPITKRFWTN